MGAFFFLLEEPETFFSKLLILLTILSMDFCIFSMAFPCHLLNFWRSPILLWQPQQRGSSLEPHTPQSNSTQAHPNPHSPGLILSSTQLDPQLDRAQAPLLANHPHAQLMCTQGVGLAKLDVHPTWFSGSLSVGFTPAAHKIGVMSPPTLSAFLVDV
ncbi:unnamed protein product [Microthlaspi erraticum]|uniref:Uncharacterized protein n=1 Tax=Microthlaspi erraticum TaxID=1685480 RepID=A0A6D2I135_9BRAS|nr:unnamed protein product [Microthlaspi erraticum]